MEVILKTGRTVPITEWSSRFMQHMLNAMSMSFFKFGRLRDSYPDNVDALTTLELMLHKYRVSGNQDFLVDIANYAMIEFMHPSVEGSGYYPGDTGRDTRAWRKS